MSPSAELIRVALLALVTGLAIPLLVQLFLTLRGLRRTADLLERRLDGALSDIGAVAADLRRSSTAAPVSVGAALAAAAPAIVAAVRAFRASIHEDHHPAGPASGEAAAAAAAAARKEARS